MVKDTRWHPAALFIVARSVQLFFAVLVLGICAFFATYYSLWYIGYTIAVALLTIIHVCVNFGLYFNNLLLPLAVVIIDPILFVLWLVAVCAVGVGNEYTLAGQCSYISYDYDWGGYVTVVSGECHLLKSGFAAMVLEMIALIPSIVLASIVMHKTRKDSVGKKHNLLRKSGGDNNTAPPEYKNAVVVQQRPYHPQYQQNTRLPQQPQYQQAQYQQAQYQQNATELELIVYPQYPQGTPGMQPGVYPPQPTGTPGPYPGREYTVSPPLTVASNQENTRMYEMSGGNQGGNQGYR